MAVCNVSVTAHRQHQLSGDLNKLVRAQHLNARFQEGN